jgi:hypothetical protein
MNGPVSASLSGQNPGLDVPVDAEGLQAPATGCDGCQALGRTFHGFSMKWMGIKWLFNQDLL